MLTVEKFLSEQYEYGLFEVRNAADGKLIFTSRNGKTFDKCRKCKIIRVDSQIRLHKYKDSSYAVLVIYINTAVVIG
jgi:hypothetical protein